MTSDDFISVSNWLTCQCKRCGGRYCREYCVLPRKKRISYDFAGDIFPNENIQARIASDQDAPRIWDISGGEYSNTQISMRSTDMEKRKNSLESNGNMRQPKWGSGRWVGRKERWGRNMELEHEWSINWSFDASSSIRIRIERPLQISECSETALPAH